jgi:hypothetical protein
MHELEHALLTILENRRMNLAERAGYSPLPFLQGRRLEQEPPDSHGLFCTNRQRP